MGGNTFQGRVFGQGVGCQIQQPRAHHAPIAPNFGDLVQVEPEFRLVLHQLKPFGISLHQSVFDAIVDHLHEMAGATGTDISPPFVCCWSQGLEDGAQLLHDGLIAANHHAVTLGQPPNATTGPNIDEMEAFLFEHRRPAQRIFVIAVATINDAVAGRQNPDQLFNSLLGRLPRRNHNPDRPRGRQLGRHFF